MKNIILITHGRFADGIIDSVKIIMGKLTNAKIDKITITSSETILLVSKLLEEKILSFNNDYPTIIFTDIAGGSTTQIAIKCLQNHGKKLLYLITGLNLALLLEIITLELNENDSENKEKLRNAINFSRTTINLVNDILEKESHDSML